MPSFYLDTEFIEAGRNVPLQLISIGIVHESGDSYYAEADWFDPSLANDFVKANVLPKLKGGVTARNAQTMRAQITRFMSHGLAENEVVKVYGYYADYDWVLFCQLFGAMVDLPKFLPYYCRDLKQTIDEVKEKTGVNLSIPSPEGEHNALTDARWNQQLHWAILAHQRKTP